MKEIIKEWKNEVYKRHGDSGYTFIAVEPDYPDDHIIITTSHRLFWEGIEEELLNKYSKKLKEKGYTVEVRILPFSSVILSFTTYNNFDIFY